MFRAGYKLQLNNVPSQWTATKVQKAQPKRILDTSGRQQESGARNHDRCGSTPFQRTDQDNGTGRGNNPNYPKAFSNSKLKDLRAKFSGITLNEISREAGIREGASGIDTTGLPERTCMTWICMGQCSRPHCVFQHPEHVNEAVAEGIYKQLEPGVKRIMEAGKRPTLRGGRN
jgi:hypothetical protein